MKHSSAGIFYAFGAAFALSASFIFSKSALNQVSMVQFGTIWFSLGVIWNTLWFVFHKDYKQIREGFRDKLIIAFIVAVIEGGATGLFYLAIRAMENPAIVSFIGNIGPVFVTIFAFLVLKERFNRMQVAGILITLIGVFVINYREGGVAGFLETGALYVIAASFLFATATILGRKYKEIMVPGFMSLIRAVLLSLLFIILFFTTGEQLNFELNVWRDLALGSILETLLTIVFAYQALKLIEATKTSLIISTRSVWVLILAWIFLDVFPLWYQLTGGLLTLAGVWLITWDRAILRKG